MTTGTTMITTMKIITMTMPNTDKALMGISEKPGT